MTDCFTMDTIKKIKGEYDDKYNFIATNYDAMMKGLMFSKVLYHSPSGVSLGNAPIPYRMLIDSFIQCQ